MNNLLGTNNQEADRWDVMTNIWCEEYERETLNLRSINYAGRLQEILEGVGRNPRDDCNFVVKTTKKSIHSGLQSCMHLTRRKGRGLSIVVSDYVPEPILQLLEQVPDTLMRLIALHDQIQQTLPLLDELSASQDSLYRDLDIGIDASSSKQAASDLRALMNVRDERVAELLHMVESSEADLLGQYWPMRGRIEIHWISIFVVANALGVPMDRLTYVVLAHELAHYYSHDGIDADHRYWEPEDFCESNICILEGLAQFWTNELCNRSKVHFGILPSHTTRDVFEELLQHQGGPYHCFKEWAPSHRRRAEIVRGAMLKIREGVGDYRYFESLLTEFEAVYD